VETRRQRPSNALKKLDETALAQGSLEDERYALSQLVMILPQETSYADRLRVINEKHGFTDNLYDEKVLQYQFEEQSDSFLQELSSFDISDAQPVAAESVSGSSEAEMIERTATASHSSSRTVFLPKPTYSKPIS
jgi:hypothetical protein